MRYVDCAAADRRLLAAMRAYGGRPGVAVAVRALSLAGEHAALWIAAGLTGAAADPERRGRWLRATAVVGGAHLASMGVKHVVRRPRPELPSHRPLVHTLGRHSFPSSHAASAAAAAVAFGALLPAARRLAPPLAAAMCVSRLVAGVHYPTDIAAGAVLGGLAARAGARWAGGAVSPGFTGARAAGRPRGRCHV
ncbi:phosphatase PAP2 family protein [Streptomyces sp. NPDC008141]|uniref:phosphatase PAP2 family protein n=1 Tax=Streptomyces sp. NPDC008141 TaxID=3364815 RepID=UPI0036EB181A